ncbi:heavy metal-binding domain-containing protein [Marinobacter daqiaonensis]|uniref:heavy metal-binding domain-containing protein n=1 Tax=Marinobacter daqiaonensis TaxID=650891 RepID=UPI001D123329
MLQKLFSRALASNLSCLVVPGPEIALAHGLDVKAVGMRIAGTPRDASVLLIVGKLPEKMSEAVAVLFAQMPRLRAILVLGARPPSSLPGTDVSGDLSQAALIEAVARLKQVMAKGAFASSPEDFDSSVLHARTEYVCPMHPEVVEDEPGSCPKCGMDLVARETGESTPEHHHDHEHEHHHHGHDHGEHEDEHEQCHGHEDREHQNHHDHRQDHEPEHHPDHNHDHSEGEGHKQEKAETEYTCPMHPEIVRDEPGSCPKCGMDLVAREDMEDDGGGEEAPGHGNDHEHQHHHDHSDYDEHDHEHHQDDGHEHGHGHSGHEHGGHDHGASGFMSMIEVTKDLPRSADGLQMDWLEVPFGPVFPGLPGGLKLTLTLDGDGVTEGQAASVVGITSEGEEDGEMDANTFIEHLSSAMPLAPVSYRLLACLAIERAAGLEDDSANAGGRTGALERERIASHLGWLARFGHQMGFAWLANRASTLQLNVQAASKEGLIELEPSLQALATRVGRTPLLKARLRGIGVLPTGSSDLRGPVGRASGKGGDAWARLWQRLDEIPASLDLIKAAVEPELPVLRNIGSDVSGTGETTVETPRGESRLKVSLEHGQVTSYELDTACSHHIDLVAELVKGRELGDALVAVGSIDLSPWEVIS